MKNDPKFLRVRNDPIAAVPVSAAPVAGGTQIEYWYETGITSTGDGEEWIAESALFNFLTDKRIQMTVVAAWQSTDPATISISSVGPNPFLEGFFNGVMVSNASVSYPGPSVSWTAVIDLPAGEYSFIVNGRGTPTSVADIAVSWNLVAVDHTYVPSVPT